MIHRIRNYHELARTPVRRDVLDIIEAGFTAIDTDGVVRSSIRLDSNILTIDTRRYDLSKFRHVHVFGFGKASCAAAAALSQILGDRITQGIALGSETRTCRVIDLCEATHPLPSEQNVRLSERVVKECESVDPDDLVLIIVSGGGSAMLCWPASECEQGKKLYEVSLRAGLTIQELNTVRKHISALKGGGLVKLLHPATVIGLIFSDVPGDHPNEVASGPTYSDTTTIADAQKIIDQYALGSFELMETPKDRSLFERVENIVLVSNVQALTAMEQKAKKLGYTATILASDLSDEPEILVQKFIDRTKPHSAILGGGETHFVVTPDIGSGGRNQYVAQIAAKHIASHQLFASVASDGLDNGPSAGAIAEDGKTELLMTGPTGANVSDLMVLLTP